LAQTRNVLLIKTLAACTGPHGMICGQAREFFQEEDKRQIDLEKTGALFSAACTIPAIIASKNTQPFKQAGSLLGLAYQIQDDILDHDTPNNFESLISLKDEICYLLPPSITPFIQEMLFDKTTV